MRYAELTESEDKLTAFMQELWNSTWPHPFMRGERLTSNAWMSVRPWNGMILLKTIMSIEPGQGGASEGLKLICDLADEHKVKVTLTAKKYGTRDPSLTTEQLRDWYKRYGFVVERGNKRDGYDMVREPR